MNPFKLITRGKGIAALLVVVLAAAATLGLLAAVMTTQGSGSVQSALISYNVDYVVRDAGGRVKEQGSVHNAVNDPEALNEVFQRITGGGTSHDYDEIGALSVDTLTDDPANGVLETSITLNLDGDIGSNGNQNPANGTVTTDFATESGNGTVEVSFIATADGTEVKQIVFTKNSDDNTNQGGAKDIDDADIFAYVDVQDVALDTNDSVTYTWTIDVD